MGTIKDCFGNSFTSSKIPVRIVSLCPSITETLCDLGHTKKIVGITDYCIHPREITEVAAKVGGPKTLNIEQILELKNIEKVDIIFLPSEPYKFSAIDKEFLASLGIANEFVFVDGEMFSWYGTHMLKSAVYFQDIISQLKKV